MPKYGRILLKLSGEALMGEQKYGISMPRLDAYAQEIENAGASGVQIGIVMGGGNIFRGLQGMNDGVNRIQGDYMGMLATVINSLALQSALEKKGLKTKLLSGLPVDPVAESMSSRKAIEALENGFIVIIAGGTGRPYFTTDTTAALRALEISADALLKGTRVDGVYTADPEKFPDAKRFDTVSFDEAIDKGLKVMDITAFTLCKENKMPIVVFDMNKPGNLTALVNGQDIGTLVK
ncbi:MAG: UMP kinase [Bacteroidetes bacterium]|nr:UMP kinase [Bacteroidota bacterium]